MNDRFTVRKWVREPLVIHDIGDEEERENRVYEALEQAGLAPVEQYLSRYPHELSGGQRQRVAVAVALALSPRLVVADEPTSALDSVSAGRILDLLVRLTAEEGAALVLITHDLSVARRAGRLAVMAEGRIVEEGATQQILHAPRSCAARALVEGSRIALPPRPPWRPPTGPPALAARGITVARAGRTLVADASLAVSAGERLALVGRSGAGKTTLMRAILGLAPRTGEVTVDGTPVERPDAPRLRRKAQMVFQDPATSFNPRHAVGRIVTEPLHRSGLGRAERIARAAAALERVGLERTVLARKPHAFSGGQRQRIAIARALVAGPAVLVADEAVSALDAALRADMVRLLDRLTRQEGIALVFIAHDLALVELLADRIVVMDEGRIVETGSVAQIFEAPRHPATEALVREARHERE
jgi:peptide/nickel transport system ATP-binding protein